MIDDIRTKIHLITDTIYEEFAVPNPYVPPQRASRAEYTAFGEPLTHSTLSDFPSSYTPAVADVGCQIPPLELLLRFLLYAPPSNLSGALPILSLVGLGAHGVLFYRILYALSDIVTLLLMDVYPPGVQLCQECPIPWMFGIDPFL